MLTFVSKKVISVKVREHKYFPPDSTPVLIAPIEKSLDGKIYTVNKGLEVIIVEDLRTVNGHHRIVVQFLQTGFKKETDLWDLKRGSIKDSFFSYTPNFGYMGKGDSVQDNLLAGIWRNMLSRCYDIKHKHYGYYGAKGVSVYKPWWNFGIFAEEAKLLHGWEYFKNEPCKYQLDKDYYSAGYYGPDSCVWSDRFSNIAYAKCKAFSAYKNGEYVNTYLAIKDAEEETGINRNGLYKNLRNIKTSATGDYTFKYLQEIPGYVYRFNIG